MLEWLPACFLLGRCNKSAVVAHYGTFSKSVISLPRNTAGSDRTGTHWLGHALIQTLKGGQEAGRQPVEGRRMQATRRGGKEHAATSLKPEPVTEGWRAWVKPQSLELVLRLVILLLIYLNAFLIRLVRSNSLRLQEARLHA